MHLTDDELRSVLTRAQDIQRSSLHGSAFDSEVESVIQAAEEVGLSRAAVVRALRERADMFIRPPEPGKLVFAQSVDGKFYVADVLSVNDDGVAVRFLRGSEHVVGMDELRPCSLLPGERVVCDWPWWGPWTCTVLSFDADSERVKVSDGSGSTRTFAISDIWLNAPRKSVVGRAARRRVYATLIGLGAGVGALIASILTALLMR
jgi:hypothetical protein